ncbi:queuosine precursor transporter [Paracrocinitomix mangrovi]|uniref:queuosine precursor transporter n=1 Tax=Paracrocinitomix mangrovi TaxID=2862509 RepID=UPI001C8E452A|nr:queuosine precursor transporter [Paracrocinitomix mangrovi]UKN02303.1 queuosine precursor transporter [Paracrocinitomix mangrovi]
MDKSKLKQARLLYLLLAGVFISLLVSCNLIFLKFIDIDFGFTVVPISVGLLPYPLTFLVTDLISEIFGEKRANDVVKVGLVCALLVIGFTYLADQVPAGKSTVLSDAEFHKTFGLAGVSVTASMLAYLLAQFIDIKIYHFWKRKTEGRMLWLRNNFSTFSSQIIDTLTIMLLLCTFGAIPWDQFQYLVLGSVIYKLIVALADTPFLYLFVYLIKRHFNLERNEEIDLDA